MGVIHENDISKIRKGRNKNEIEKKWIKHDKSKAGKESTVSLK